MFWLWQGFVKLNQNILILQNECNPGKSNPYLENRLPSVYCCNHYYVKWHQSWYWTCERQGSFYKWRLGNIGLKFKDPVTAKQPEIDHKANEEENYATAICFLFLASKHNWNCRFLYPVQYLICFRKESLWHTKTDSDVRASFHLSGGSCCIEDECYKSSSYWLNHFLQALQY